MQILGRIPQRCVVYSLIGALSVERLAGLLGVRHIIRPPYQGQASSAHLTLSSHQLKECPPKDPCSLITAADTSMPRLNRSKTCIPLTTPVTPALTRGFVEEVEEQEEDEVDKYAEGGQLKPFTAPMRIVDRLRTRPTLDLTFPLGGQVLRKENGLDWMVQLAICMLNAIRNIVSLETAVHICNEVLFGLPKDVSHSIGLKSSHFQFFLTELDGEETQIWSAQDDLERLVHVRQVFADPQVQALVQTRYNELFLTTIIVGKEAAVGSKDKRKR